MEGPLPEVAKVAQAGLGWFELTMYSALATLFGLLRYLQEVPEPAAFRWFLALTKGTAAGGAGFLTGLLMEELHTSRNWTWILVALAGYAGAELLNAAKEAGLDYLRRKAQRASDAPAEK